MELPVYKPADNRDAKLGNFNLPILGIFDLPLTLFEAASSVIHQVKRFSRLKSWAARLAGRRGFRKAAVATARKIAVLMLTLWKNGSDYQWTKEATA
ncbi:hypothetical protein [Donghicola sp.]|jgi:hypothetical protein|uniref:hypothetical protein n=1 Tax=Donghicola sp. TaxID=1929294 RepID=UPI0025E1CA78|nr:hypothetical protein [Donghicola sp.]MCT4576785.1 hypothetical protein [Donghicola sp.]